MGKIIFILKTFLKTVGKKILFSIAKRLIIEVLEEVLNRVKDSPEPTKLTEKAVEEFTKEVKKGRWGDRVKQR